MQSRVVEKIAAIAKTVSNLLKQGDNGEYKFIRAVDAFDAVRIKLFEAGILIAPIKQETRSNPFQAISGDVIEEVFTEVTYRITDGVTGDFIDCCAHGVGRDFEGKALYMASTGAKKDLIKTLFLIAGWEDDAEGQTDVARIATDLGLKIAEMEKTFGRDSQEWPISHHDVIAWGIACKKTGYKESAKKAFLKSRKVENISALKRKDLSLAFKWANGEEASLGEDSSSADTESAD